MGQIETLLRAYLREGIPQFLTLCSTTLQQISLGGIYDHIGGGIARYATDETWTVPHFEKMLYDNAQYIDMLTMAWQLDRSPLYAARVEESIEWILRDMLVEDAFASSIDADSEQEEGKYYIWSEAEIDAVLAGTFTQKFKQVYNVTAQGNHNGKNILHRLGPQSLFGQSAADEALLKRQRASLLEVRNKRIAPLRDDKVQTDWNGLIIAALANAGAVFKRSSWTVAAIRAFDFIATTLGSDDLLYHSWRSGRRQHAGFAEDYAHMARAALVLWQSTDDVRYLGWAKKWVRTLNNNFWDTGFGGYFQTSNETDSLIARVRTPIDQFMPCANGVMPAVLSRLYLATYDETYRNNCNSLIQAFTGEINGAYLGMTTFINSLETAVNGLQIVIVGPLTDPRTHELTNAVMGRALPDKLLVRIDPNEELPISHPARGKKMIDGRPAAYICQRGACGQPITNPVQLSQAMQLPGRNPAMPTTIGTTRS
jgi:hypothetical protein